MMTSTVEGGSKRVGQEHCIDLPGESVQCWVGSGTQKLKVILRKHRDIVFDLHLGNGKSYSVESTESDFYNANEKKLVFAARRTPVVFRDGQRLHLWVSRGFRGALIVKCEGRLVAKVTPSEWDQTAHGDDPKEKPAPIIIAIGKEMPIAPHTTLSKERTQATALPVSKLPMTSPAPDQPRPVAAHLHEYDCPVVCVVDGNVKGMPADLWEFFQKGGDGTGFSTIDPFRVSTRNWILGQLAGIPLYAKDNWSWLRASIEGKSNSGFKLVKAKIHYVRGKVRFYFSGYSKANLVYRGGGFGPGHERILTIFAGVGKSASTFLATMKAIAGTFKGAALANFIFGSATAYAEWQADAKKDRYDLVAALLTSALKAVLVAALVSLTVAAIVWLVMMVVGTTMAVIAVGLLTVGLSIGFSYAVDAVDKLIAQKVTHQQDNTDGVASIVAPWLREAGKRISASWNELMQKMPRDYSEMHFEGP